MDNIRESLGRQGLVRPRDGRVLGRRDRRPRPPFRARPLARALVFVLLMIIIPGHQFLLYPLLWVLMPSEEAPAAGPTFTAPPAAA